MANANNSGPRGDALGPASSSPPAGWEVLFTHEGLERLNDVQSALASGESQMQVNTRLRKQGVAGDEAAALLTQANLRQKARIKFGDSANQMLFTQAGLEQASRAEVARLHAQRFVAAGCSTVADLGCGIGTESAAFLQAGLSVFAVEIDTFTALIAKHNLEVASNGLAAAINGNSNGSGNGNGNGSATFQLVVADATQVPLESEAGVYLDPARRTAGHSDTRRLAKPDDYSPSLDFAFGIAQTKTAGIKLGPGFDRELIPDHAEAQWVSVDGQVVETGLWFGAAARDGIGRSALVFKGGQAHELTASMDAADVEPTALGDYIYEPDGAVIRARLIGLLAERIGAAMLSDGIAYLTSNTLVPTQFAQSFRVIEQLPVSEKPLSRALAARNIGTLEIKKRGTDVDPAALRRRLRLKGREAATLILTRAASKHVALLVERC